MANSLLTIIGLGGVERWARSRLHNHRIHKYFAAKRPGDNNSQFAMQELLFHAADVLEKHRIPYWLDCGTLLGAWRQGNNLPQDADVDIGILEEDADRVVDHLKGDLKPPYEIVAEGLCPRVYNRLIKFPKKTRHYLPKMKWPIHVDLRIFKLEDGFVKCSDRMGYDQKRKYQSGAITPEGWSMGKPKPVPAEWVFPLAKCRVRGREFSAPRETETYLEFKYGCIGEIGKECVWNPDTQKLEKIKQ
ncbi:MAG: LicD family protein [Candidatus Omnitrophota bacterium]|nr:LicD family protein [Candidatus Omnitrophota bacterium]